MWNPLRPMPAHFWQLIFYISHCEFAPIPPFNIAAVQCAITVKKTVTLLDRLHEHLDSLVVFTFGVVGSQGRWYYHWFSVQLTNDKRERDWNLSSTFIDCLIFRNFLTLFRFCLNVFVGCFIYILDSSNSSSFPFWSSQFASSSRSNWTVIWNGSSVQQKRLM